MKNTSILFYILLWLFSVSSCNQKKHQVTLLEKFTVPQEDHPEWTDLFTDKYTITPLETTPESLVGEINKTKSSTVIIIFLQRESPFCASMRKVNLLLHLIKWDKVRKNIFVLKTLMCMK